jgi:hypothetical protein
MRLHVLLTVALAAFGLTACPGSRPPSTPDSATPEKDPPASVTVSSTPAVAVAPLRIDRQKVKPGDRVGAFLVKSVERQQGSLVDVTLEGELEVDVTYTYSDFTGDGDGWILEIDARHTDALPYLDGENPEQIRSWVTSNPVESEAAFGKGTADRPASGTARVVLDTLSIGERQIDRRARLVRTLLITPAVKKQ